jgi:uncharacterized protein (TIGR03437 family)
VAAASTAATFTTTAGTIAANQTATVTATLNGTTQTATLALASQMTLTGLSCTPSSLGSGTSSTCTVTVSQTGGATVALSSNLGALTVPASVTVASASNTATFTATAGTIASNQTATITATLNGTTQTASVALTAPVTLSGLSCTPSTLGSGGVSTCTVTVSQAGAVTVGLSSNLGALSVPALVTVAPASTTATFTATAGTIATNQTATVIATLNGSTTTTTISLNAASIEVTSLSCSPDSGSVGALLCKVQLSEAAPSSGATVALGSSSTMLQLPSTLVIPGGSQAATFVVSVASSDQDQQPQITASIQGVAQTTSPQIIGIRPTTLTCPTETIQAGNWLSCEIQMNSSNVPQVVHLVLSASDPALRIPATITTRPGQTELPFMVYAAPLAQPAASGISVQFDQTVVSEPVSVTPGSAPILTIPNDVDTVFGRLVSLTVSAVDPAGLTVVLSASGLPGGATFDPGTGEFSWTPGQSQQGVYSIAFTATNSAAASSTGNLTITVDSGKPIITDVHNAASGQSRACSPGSLASLSGRWLASSGPPVADPSGASMELGGTQVKINGEYVPVVYASTNRIDFVCPQTNPGTYLTVSAETEAGTAGPVSTMMYQETPGLYSLDGSGTGQGMVTLAGTSLLATGRTYLAQGQPAEPGDSIAIRATGIGTSDSLWPTVKIGGIWAQVESLQAVPGTVGVYEITVEAPVGLQEGSAIPVVVSFPAAEPLRAEPLRRTDIQSARETGCLSNTVTIAVEPSAP